MGREFSSNELPSLIEDIFTFKDLDEKIRCLPREGAQAFIDVMSEARYLSAHYHESAHRN